MRLHGSNRRPWTITKIVPGISKPYRVRDFLPPGEGAIWWVSESDILTPPTNPQTPAPAVVPDDIERPTHYARYAIEPITFIMANNLPFCVGNVVKYVLRYDAKNGREDLMKARRYIDMILEDMERKEKGTEGDAVGKPL